MLFAMLLVVPIDSGPSSIGSTFIKLCSGFRISTGVELVTLCLPTLVSREYSKRVHPTEMKHTSYRSPENVSESLVHILGALIVVS